MEIVAWGAISSIVTPITQFLDARNWGRVLFCALALAIITLSLLFSAMSIGKSNTGVSLVLDNNGWVVDSVDPNGAGIQAGIEVGDRPININGQPADEFLKDYENTGIVVQLIINKLIVIDSNGQVKTLDMEQIPSSAKTTIIIFSQLIVSIIFWITAAYSFFKGPDMPPRGYFAFVHLV